MSLSTVPQDSLGELDCRRYASVEELRDHVDASLRQRLLGLDEAIVSAVDVDVAVQSRSTRGIYDPDDVQDVVRVRVERACDRDRDLDEDPVRRVVAEAVDVAHSTGRCLDHSPHDLLDAPGRAVAESITIPYDTEVPA